MGRSFMRPFSGMFAVAALLVAVAAPAAAADTPLRTLAEAKGLYFGTAIERGMLSNSTYTGLAGAQFDMITPANEMKWDTTEPAQGQFNFGPGDAIVDFAKAHGQRVRGHNLVWHSQLPSWVSNGNFSAAQVSSVMQNHITSEVTHYRGSIYAWDVVNEPFNEDGTYRADVFYNALGVNYIADALTWAHAADPDAKLYLNDYNIEGLNAKSDAMYNLVKSLKSQGVPIGGVGLESHFILGQVPSTMQANIERFVALGVDVAVTELDDRIQLPASSANLTQQANDYTAVINACLAVQPGCAGVTTWGFTDADTWVTSSFPGYGAPLPWDTGYQPKPAYTALQTALGGTATEPPPTSAGCSVTYTPSQWSGGFTADVKVVNTSSTAISGWTVTFAFPGDQKVTNAWNATVTQSGANVTAKNVSYNGTIPPGGSTSFGFQGTWSGSNTSPTVFSVNGTTCG